MAVTCEEFIESLDTDSRIQLDRLARHTLNCEKCHNLWRMHQRLTLSARAPDDDEATAMSSELVRALSGHHAVVRGSSRARRLMLVVAPLAVGLAWAWLGLARPDLHAAATWPFWGGAAVLAVGFSICSSVLVRRDANGFGVAPRVRWACVLGTLALFPVFATVQALHEPQAAGLTLPRDCLLFGLAISLALSGAAFYAIRRSVIVAPSASAGLAGCVGGLGGLLWLHVHCAAGAGLHVLVVHGLAFALALLTSTLVGRRWLLSP